VETQTKATLEEMRRIGRLPKVPEPQALPVRCFRMSKFGEQFIAFVTKKRMTRSLLLEEEPPRIGAVITPANTISTP